MMTHLWSHVLLGMFLLPAMRLASKNAAAGGGGSTHPYTYFYLGF